MQIKLGEKIKELRKRDGRIPAECADAIRNNPKYASIFAE